MILSGEQLDALGARRPRAAIPQVLPHPLWQRFHDWESASSEQKEHGLRVLLMMSFAGLGRRQVHVLSKNKY